MGEIVLPKERRGKIAVDPDSILIYSSPKAGKTTVCADLPNSLILELEPKGADFVDANVIDIKNPKHFEEVLIEIQKQNNPYDFLIVDTVTKMDIQLVH